MSRWSRQMKYFVSLFLMAFPLSASAQVLLENEIWNAYYKGVAVASVTQISKHTCTIYWDNWVYAYGLNLISPQMENGLPTELKRAPATLKREKWLIEFQIEQGVDQFRALDMINGESNPASNADYDLNQSFNGNKDATNRYFQMLGECSAP